MSSRYSDALRASPELSEQHIPESVGIRLKISEQFTFKGRMDQHRKYQPFCRQTGSQAKADPPPHPPDVEKDFQQSEMWDKHFYRTQVSVGSDLWVLMSVSQSVTPRGLADLTDVTLADEDSNSIPTDDVNG